MNRPLSMTAFGRGESTDSGRTWIVEVRTVNHRYLDVSIRLPRRYGSLEERVRQKVAALFSRGRVEVMIECAGQSTSIMSLQVNMALAREYHHCLQSLKSELSLDGNPELAMFTALKDVIVPMAQEDDLEVVWQALEPALAEALHGCVRMRGQEGQNLKKDLLARLGAFAQTVGEIHAMIPVLVTEKEENLKARLTQLLAGQNLDPGRLAQEVALLADKTDVTEEVVRLHSHIEQFAAFLELDEAVGRRLDFLLQEFLREINTMASKINNSRVAHWAVELKNELEKMREQVQNLE